MAVAPDHGQEWEMEPICGWSGVGNSGQGSGQGRAISGALSLAMLQTLSMCSQTVGRARIGFWSIDKCSEC